MTKQRLSPLAELGAAAAPQPPPKPRRHFTTFQQIDDLVRAREMEPSMSFVMRLLLLCSLPRTNPGKRTRYIRRNGPHTLVMSAAGQFGLPYGNIPRLLLAWVCTEAVRTQSRELTLGSSMHEFMERLGIESSDSGGATGVRTRLRDQMNRLFYAAVSFSEQDGGRDRFVASMIAEKGEFWWDPKLPGQATLWESSITLGERFYEELLAHPVPIDANVLRAMKRSSLGLDLYFWLTYRTFSLRAPLRLGWRQIYLQFGASPENATWPMVRDFRRKCLRELKKLRLAWPDLEYETPRGMVGGVPVAAADTPAAAAQVGRGSPQQRPDRGLACPRPHKRAPTQYR